MTRMDVLINQLKRWMRSDLAVCLKCGCQITNGSVTKFCKECGAPNLLFDPKKFQEKYGQTAEEHKAACREYRHYGLSPTRKARATWDAPYCPHCGARLSEP